MLVEPLEWPIPGVIICKAVMKSSPPCSDGRTEPRDGVGGWDKEFSFQDQTLAELRLEAKFSDSKITALSTSGHWLCFWYLFVFEPFPIFLYLLLHNLLPNVLHWAICASLVGSFPAGKSLSIHQCLPLPVGWSSWSSGWLRDSNERELRDMGNWSQISGGQERAGWGSWTLTLKQLVAIKYVWEGKISRYF